MAGGPSSCGRRPAQSLRLRHGRGLSRAVRASGSTGRVTHFVRDRGRVRRHLLPCGGRSRLHPRFHLTHQADALAVDVAFAGAIAVGVFAFGHGSGAHFNPAVTLGLWSAEAFPARCVPGYPLAQATGATLASLVLLAVYRTVSPGVTLPSQGSAGILPSLLIEFFGAYLLVTTVCGTAVDKRAPAGVAGLAIGGAILLAGLMGVPQAARRSTRPAPSARRSSPGTSPTAGSTSSPPSWEAWRRQTSTGASQAAGGKSSLAGRPIVRRGDARGFGEVPRIVPRHTGVRVLDEPDVL